MMDERLKMLIREEWVKSGGSVGSYEQVYKVVDAVLSASGLVALEQIEQVLLELGEREHATMLSKKIIYEARWRFARLSAPAAPAQPRPLTPEEQHTMQEFGEAVQRDVIDPLVKKENERMWGAAQPAETMVERKAITLTIAGLELTHGKDGYWLHFNSGAKKGALHLHNTFQYNILHETIMLWAQSQTEFKGVAAPAAPPAQKES